MREDVIQKGFSKARKVFDKLNASRDMEYIKDTAKITKRLSLQFECIRADVGTEDYIGTPVSFEIYAVKDGKEIDCCTLYVTADVNAEIMYLLNCYV